MVGNRPSSRTGEVASPSQRDPQRYLHGLVKALRLEGLPITPDIAALSRSKPFIRQDPADRLIAATAIVNRSSFITADEKLRALPRLRAIW